MSNCSTCGNNNNNKEKATNSTKPTAQAATSAAEVHAAKPPLALTRPPGLKFALQMLGAHNAYREHHGAPALSPCPILTMRAQCWAERLAQRNCMFHDSQQLDGENLAVMYGAPGNNCPGDEFVNQWYYEGLHYRFPGTQLGSQNGKGGSHVTGHFTQLVWKSSKQVGFGRAVSKTGRVYVVARYRPRGNYIGWYNANVLPPKGGKLRSRYCF